MKKTMVRLLGLLAVVGVAASCGGGGGKNKDFEFGGNWVWNGRVTASNVASTPVGDQIVDVLIIAQNGTGVTVVYQSLGALVTMTGTCDPEAGTFSASGLGTGPYAGSGSEVSGGRVDDNSMSGSFRATFPGNRFFAGTWTADLSSRSAAGAPAGAGAGTMRELIERLAR